MSSPPRVEPSRPSSDLVTVTGGSRPAAEPRLSPGQLFGGYRIVRILGRGGMGEVYEADDVEDGRRLALKVLTTGLDSPGDRSRFLREGQLAASVSHPNSVCVFGSDEIDGVPVIAMELMRGGTLRDRVNDIGPLPITEAVHAITDVVAGLSAAAEVGILHRDVKPSNCFIAQDGHVKIGDFGLSIPVTAADQTRLTASGTFLGTPGFCSPEQMRSETLDERSDIYAVGATLFYLLVGRPPFNEENAVRFFEKALTSPPDRPCDYRVDIPEQLSAIVESCLAKDRTARPQSYEALLKALRPFGEFSEGPAPLHLRALAGIVDALAVELSWISVGLLIRAPSGWSISQRLLSHTLMEIVVGTLYFAIPEAIVGASLGKYLCDLRVVGEDGSRIAMAQSFVRAGIVFSAFLLPTVAALALNFSTVPEGNALRVAAVAGPAALAFLFFTVRRANGFRGVHEILSDTRTVAVSAEDAAHKRQAHPRESVTLDAPTDEIGPYRVLTRFPQDPSKVLAYDHRLRRRVWLRLDVPGASIVSRARRDLSRPARLRWLGGKHASEEHWDAYEYVEGQPFLLVAQRERPFHIVARWVLALACECRDSMLDGTLSTIALDQLWITASGQLKVLDWRVPPARTEDDVPHPVSDIRRCQHLLSEFATRALTGHPGTRQTVSPLPLHGRAFVESLRQASFGDFETLLTACETTAGRESMLPSRRRAASIAPIAAIALASIAIDVSPSLWKRWNDQQTLLPAQFIACLKASDRIERGPANVTSDREQRAAALCVSVLSHSVDTTRRDIWLQVPNVIELRDRARAAHPSASVRELEAAWPDLPVYTALIQHVKGFAEFSPLAVATIVARGGVAGVIALSILGALCFSLALLILDGPIFRALGIAIVTRDRGVRSRARACARSGINWSLPIAAAGVLALMPPTAQGWHASVAWLILVAMAIGAVDAIVHPRRGIADRISGTCLVRR